ncbi:S8 family peptidase [Streptomyces chartreusis]|uniref:S8 family peptidase n=1 Tax=Streptomyces chartreusis TaxID=1969 RepID=UPI00369A28C3
MSACTSSREATADAGREGSLARTATPSPGASSPSRGAVASRSPWSESTAAGPVLRGVPWNLDRLDQSGSRLDHRYHTRATGKGVRIYVIDCGLDVKHQQFGSRAIKGVDTAGGKVRECYDEMGTSHGLFVAGIVGGKDTGVAKESTIVSVRTMQGGEGAEPVPREQEEAAIVRGLNWVASHAEKPAVVNMSLNFDNPAPMLEEAVKKVIDKGITVVASAGNDGQDACNYPPADIPAVITVAASTKRDRPWISEWGSSNEGRCVDLYAPGHDITSLVPENLTDRYKDSGATSWAAPHVTGAVALYLENRPLASPSEVASWLTSHATRDALHRVPAHTSNLLLNVHGL